MRTVTLYLRSFYEDIQLMPAVFPSWHYSIQMSSITLLIFCFPGITFACGSIYSPEVPWYDAVGEYDRKIIDDCANPFGRTQADFPGDISVIVDGVTMTADGVFTIAATGTENHRVTYGNYPGLEIGWFLHTERGYEFIKTSPSTPTRDDIEALAEEFFAPDVNYAHFVSEVLGEAPGIDYDDDAERTLLREFYQYIDAEYEPITPTLMPGTYTVVVVESYVFPVEVPRPWYLEWLIPEAYAAVPVGDNTYTLTFTLAAEVIPEEPTGASSVLFLPGIQASRLYKTGVLGTEDQLWEPNTNQDVRQLAMTEDGASVEDIYTKDVIDEVLFPTAGDNVYKSFLALLEEMKDDGIIADAKAFPYDWRYFVQTSVTSGVQYKNEVRNIIETVESLASSSFTGKVTIIGHSNGGLLGKVLISELVAQGKENLVDKLIMIGVPQLGTPKALGVLLHGLEQQKIGGLVVDDVTAREVTRNMPGVYSLLPADRYFSESGEGVVFTDGSIGAATISAYGDIDSATSLKAFLLDAQDTRPDEVSINEPSTLNEFILESMLATRDQLDDWQAPENIEIYEVVGTGLPTIKAIEYRRFPCVAAICALQQNNYIKPYPLFTNDGDKTVVSISAQAYEGDKVTAVIQLKEEGDGVLNKEREHYNLTESPAVQEFVASAILYPYVTDALVTPDFTKTRSEYTIIGVHSPVQIKLEAVNGKRVGVYDGEVIEEVIGSEYLEFGGSSYIIVPKETNYTVTIKGVDSGVFSLTIDTLKQANLQENVYTYYGASTTPLLTATFTGSSTGFSTIKTDSNGDGVFDKEETLAGELVVDTNVPSYAELKKLIKSFTLKSSQERLVLGLVHVAEYLAIEKRPKKTYRLLERIALRQVENTLQLYERKQFITDVELKQTETIIKYLMK